MTATWNVSDAEGAGTQTAATSAVFGMAGERWIWIACERRRADRDAAVIVILTFDSAGREAMPNGNGICNKPK